MKKRKCHFRQQSEGIDKREKKLRNRNKLVQNRRGDKHCERANDAGIHQTKEHYQHYHNFQCVEKSKTYGKESGGSELLVNRSRYKETEADIFEHSPNNSSRDSSETSKILESNGSEIYESTSEFDLQSTTSNNTISDLSAHTDESYNQDDRLVQIFERIDYTGSVYSGGNEHLHRNLALLETFNLHNQFEDEEDAERTLPGSALNWTCSHVPNRNINQNDNENVNPHGDSVDAHVANHAIKCDRPTKASQGIEKVIAENFLSKKMLIILPFFKKRIFIEAIWEYFQSNKVKEETEGDNLKVQCFETFCKIRECATPCTDGPTDGNYPNDELIKNYFFNKLNKNQYDIKIKMDYYEVEFFFIFFLTYFRFSLYLAGFINSSFLYHSNEVHFIIFVLNRYHYFVDHMYVNDNSLPFTPNEVQDIMCTYKKCIISLLDYLDTFYPFLLLISDVIQEVHTKFKKIAHKVKQLEHVLEKADPTDRTHPSNNIDPNIMTPQTIKKINAVKKISKIKRNFFKRNGDAFAMLIRARLGSYWIDRGETCVSTVILDEPFPDNDNSSGHSLYGENLDEQIVQMIRNTRSNMLVKHTIFRTVVKLNQILNSLEMAITLADANETCAQHIISMSTLLTLKALKEMKKKDKWIKLLKHNYFYIEKSYYYFKELHEKKIIYYQIQNLFRSILNIKINVVYNPFIHYFSIEDVKNENAHTIFDYIKDMRQKNYLVTLFVFNRLIYKLQFDVATYGLLFSIYSSLKFLFFEKSSIHLITKNKIMKNKFMYLFNDIISSGNFKTYEHIPDPSRNIIKDTFFFQENSIVTTVLSTAMREVTRMRFTGQIVTNASLFYRYKRLLNYEVRRQILMNDAIHMLERNYVIREIEKNLGQMENKL
ncbi:conserved Plasmodium protein, unknown function [Plasmodium knowlesi strain H]|uniref:Uncharacterized protein n=3 Tax=Plasmodium knowlesi TaxID=5850 RepID=A0A5K1VS49_PLAKH|nr:conserved Plasmodium protein, unknown function [Plasmodium knowlesi strain H]OTN68601.1 Uncharacterized protein PKNOH_S02293800 [Plasmodium knowlesi]CAA9986443.1 conserved Plasmodium protein, unknown function [Plasmodium knowlesi strain H]SBO24310.1 conserved Plasmodium protein, unknown function [Plasmodium knowlesi strain H]SBO29691.1 conserved Plasmodium protein, unknown function [Plasmodium knowlesi strain H]VVS75917.1 conserved Plasmodium protein, unknown function [Plasmodium knowlesi s|eukprot:XP_002260992.1 hypothetical protein, conserved in Plasmodium species [Plasmodium knowlesi strain H]